MKTSLKDWPKVHERIKHVRGLDEHEKVIYARSLAATPDERWQLTVTFLRSLGLWGRWALKKFIAIMPLESIRRSKAVIMRPQRRRAHSLY